jgi:alkylation response protein AidB-like acyl-CoA dehydrogenase
VAFDLALDPSQEAVVDQFDRFFERECPTVVVRDAEPLGFAPALWEKLRRLGAPGLGVPAAQGGSDASMLDLTLVAEAAGRVLAPVPLVDHVVAARIFPRPDLVEGDVVAGLALHPARDGVWPLVPAGAVAHVIVGLDGDDLVAVRAEPPASGPRNHADAPLADRSTDGDREVVGDRDTFRRCLVEWKVLQAALLAGLAARALEIVTDYVKERSQFGRPVGAFQALQHGLADCVAPIEGTRLLAAKAAWALDQGLHGASTNDVALDHGDIDDPVALATMAFVFGSEAAALVTTKAVQYHGSYGVAREYDIQLYHRRARGWPLLLGDAVTQQLELADRLWPAGT